MSYYGNFSSNNSSIPDDDFILPPEISVTFDIKPLYWKKQVRQKTRKGMRIQDGNVNINVKTEQQIIDVVVAVCRTPAAAKEFKSVPVRFKTWKEIVIDPYQKIYQVDLDSLDQDEYKIYDLMKAGVDLWNKYYLQVCFQFINGVYSQWFYSEEFQLKSLPKESKSKSSPKGGSSPDSSVSPTGNDCSSESSMETDPLLPDFSESSPESDLFSFPTIIDGNGQHGILTSFLEAKKARIASLRVTERFNVNKGDIAYHLPLSHPEEYYGKLEEGDIVGFFPVEDEKTVIQPLDSENCEKATLAGVISRSAYLHAMTPSDSGKTDTVCVIGIVKVKVKGSVQHGERIYASKDDAGIAMPESHLPLSTVLFKNQTLLGMAMEGVKPNKLDEVNLVQCFVCIVLGITTQQQVKAVEDMYENIRMDSMVEIRKESKKTKRHFWLVLAIAAILLILLSVFIYQWFYPGSALRYFICKQGSIEGHTAQFKFIPTGDIHQRYLVRGIEFTFENLLKKIHSTSIPRINITDPHYYLNLDRCAYGTLQLGNSVDKKKQVGGPEIFVTNHTCTSFYYYDEEPVDQWIKYKSTFLFKSDLKCFSTS